MGQAPADRPQPASSASSADSPSTQSSLGIRFQEGVCECIRRNRGRRRRKLHGDLCVFSSWILEHSNVES